MEKDEMIGGAFNSHTYNLYLFDEVVQVVSKGLLHQIDDDKIQLIRFFVAELLKTYDYTAFKVLFMTYIEYFAIDNPFYINVFYYVFENLKAMKKSKSKTLYINRLSLAELLMSALLNSKANYFTTIVTNELRNNNLLIIESNQSGGEDTDSEDDGEVDIDEDEIEISTDSEDDDNEIYVETESEYEGEKEEENEEDGDDSDFISDESESQQEQDDELSIEDLMLLRHGLLKNDNISLYSKFDVLDFENAKENVIYKDIDDVLKRLKVEEMLTDDEFYRLSRLFWGYIDCVEKYVELKTPQKYYGSIVFMKLIMLEELRNEHELRLKLNNFRRRPIDKTMFIDSTGLKLSYSRKKHMEIIRKNSVLIWRVIWNFIKNYEEPLDIKYVTLIRQLYNLSIDKDVMFSESVFESSTVVANTLMFNMFNKYSFKIMTLKDLQDLVNENNLNQYVDIPISIDVARKYKIPDWALNYLTMRGRNINTTNMLINYANRLSTSSTQKKNTRNVTQDMLVLIENDYEKSHGDGKILDSYRLISPHRLIESELEHGDRGRGRRTKKSISEMLDRQGKEIIDRIASKTFVNIKNIAAKKYVDFLKQNGIDLIINDNIRIGKINVSKKAEKLSNNIGSVGLPNYIEISPQPSDENNQNVHSLGGIEDFI